MGDHVVAAGRQLGPYRMEGRIGAGGMGEIYRARDTRLNRDVAIKVLPPDVTADRTRRERFDREARSIAALNHPHVCTVHDVGSADGVDYLVLELIDGQSLAERVARGPLPLAEALARMIEVAEALCQAHRLGIIHRDLKPANIMLTRAGAKVLDFGLARIIKGPTDLLTPPASTTAAALTADGAVFGTLQYMAPEQIEGRPADARTDVFAFGSVLYEALTGRRPFEGASTPALISSILRDDPPVLAILRPGLPAAIERLVRACMAKDPDDRVASMHDVALALRWIASDLEKDQDAPRVVTGSPWHRWVLPGAIALAIGGALVSLVLGAVVWRTPRTGVQAAPEARLTMILPASAPLSGGLALSPDGTRLVYISRNDRDRTSRLYLRQLDAFEPQPIAGTEGALAAFFSPDGQTIGFFAGGELRRVPVRGGEVVKMCAAQADTGTGGTWGVDGTIVFASPATARTGLRRVPAGGGVAQMLTAPDSREGGGHGDPNFIPGTRVVLYTTRNTKAGVATSIKAVSLDTAETRTILNDAGDQPAYSQPGHLLYVKGGALLTAPFSVKLLEVTGAPVTIADEVRQFASASSGRLVYRPAATAGGLPVWVGVGNGPSATKILDGGPNTFRRPRLSPDGTRLGGSS